MFRLLTERPTTSGQVARRLRRYTGENADHRLGLVPNDQVSNTFFETTRRLVGPQVTLPRGTRFRYTEGLAGNTPWGRVTILGARATEREVMYLAPPKDAPVHDAAQFAAAGLFNYLTNRDPQVSERIERQVVAARDAAEAALRQALLDVGGLDMALPIS